jgi:Protein of unknown function (DUF2730)
MEFMKEWGAVIAFLLSAIALGRIVYQWMSADGDAAMKALGEHEKDAQARWAKAAADSHALDRRVQKLEDLMPHMPSKDDFHDLKVTMTELKGVVETLSVKVQASGDKVDSMDKYLRETGK